MIALDDLNPYSRRFAIRLFAAYPEWRELALIPPDDQWGSGTLEVVVRSPLADRELRIETVGDEVTVGFGDHGWHAHYFPWDGADESAVFSRALDDIADILSEALAVLVRFADGVVQSSETHWADEPVEFKAAERIEIVSWLGHRDATLVPG
jgi:hypothetical protein